MRRHIAADKPERTFITQMVTGDGSTVLDTDRKTIHGCYRQGVMAPKCQPKRSWSRGEIATFISQNSIGLYLIGLYFIGALLRDQEHVSIRAEYSVSRMRHVGTDDSLR